MKIEKIGIIGYGKMGRSLAHQFSDQYKIGIYSKGDFETEFEVFDSLESLCSSSDCLAITVPSKEVKSILDKLAEMEISEDKMIFDISTFKKDIIDGYKSLPEHLTVASAHPMFGEGVDTLKDENVIVVPVEGKERGADRVKRLFKRFGADVSEMSPDKHDELMKVLIGVPYFFGLSYLSLISEFEEIERYGGPSFEFLSTYGKAVLNDSPEFIEEVIDRSTDFIEKIFDDPEIEGEELNSLQKKYRKDIERSYSKLYELKEKDRSETGG